MIVRLAGVADCVVEQMLIERFVGSSVASVEVGGEIGEKQDFGDRDSAQLICDKSVPSGDVAAMIQGDRETVFDVSSGSKGCCCFGDLELTFSFVGPGYRVGHSRSDPCSDVVDGQVESEWELVEEEA